MDPLWCPLRGQHPTAAALGCTGLPRHPRSTSIINTSLSKHLPTHVTRGAISAAGVGVAKLNSGLSATDLMGRERHTYPGVDA